MMCRLARLPAGRCMLAMRGPLCSPINCLHGNTCNRLTPLPAAALLLAHCPGLGGGAEGVWVAGQVGAGSCEGI